MPIEIQTINLSRKRGDTYADQFQLKDGDGAVIDITGASFSLAVDPSETPVDDTNNKFVLTGTIVDAPNGIVEFAPSEAQAGQSNVGNWYYDAQITYSNSRKRTFAKGTYSIVQDITKT